jgi:hypothetical protein
VVLDYSTGTDPAQQVQNILAAGYAQPTKFSAGNLRTSNPANSAKGLGWRDDAANSQVVVAYTYYGDANLDGTVNALDFNAVATNFGSASPAVWSQGDFNYDGVVNTSDFMMLSNNFNQMLTIPAARVPEPAAAGMIALVFAWGMRSRRR